MRTLLKSYKTEILPTPQQAEQIRKTIGVCRFIYNLYVRENQKRYKEKKPFLSAMDFEKWLNNEYLPKNKDKKWIKDVSSKSVKRSMMNGEAAFKKFFNGKADYPNYKKKYVDDPKMYFVKNNPKDCLCERHKIKIPTLGWVYLKEKNYIPTYLKIKSGAVSVKAGRFYVSVLVEVPEMEKPALNNFGIGIDLGLKEFAVCSNGMVFHNINKTREIRRLEKKLKREQRKLSRKQENYKKKGGTAATRQNLSKQQARVQKLYQRLERIRTDYINKCIITIVKTKPSFIAIEDLNVSGMMKNRHLSKGIAAQKFYEFRKRLIAKCKEYGIQVRLVNRWYPSSKTCHKCGQIKKDLNLSDRTYICECGYVEDRDFNASLNIRDAEDYQIAC